MKTKGASYINLHICMYIPKLVEPIEQESFDEHASEPGKPQEYSQSNQAVEIELLHVSTNVPGNQPEAAYSNQ